MPIEQTPELLRDNEYRLIPKFAYDFLYPETEALINSHPDRPRQPFVWVKIEPLREMVDVAYCEIPVQEPEIEQSLDERINQAADELFAVTPSKEFIVTKMRLRRSGAMLNSAAVSPDLYDAAIATIASAREQYTQAYQQHQTQRFITRWLRRLIRKDDVEPIEPEVDPFWQYRRAVSYTLVSHTDDLERRVSIQVEQIKYDGAISINGNSFTMHESDVATSVYLRYLKPGSTILDVGVTLAVSPFTDEVRPQFHYGAGVFNKDTDLEQLPYEPFSKEPVDGKTLMLLAIQEAIKLKKASAFQDANSNSAIRI